MTGVGVNVQAEKLTRDIRMIKIMDNDLLFIEEYANLGQNNENESM